eukprot:TRINITY_DN34454_c0_g1_i1.p1 TRINITY_DN34454_c0_g1~~TRINITY_DN34454_c0_g1_i1.p1  ORF type:complete len:417 (+),score=77.85 TRINITY_DN34454_c0_g1_i1:67-1251(+)
MEEEAAVVAGWTEETHREGLQPPGGYPSPPHIDGLLQEALNAVAPGSPGMSAEVWNGRLMYSADASAGAPQLRSQSQRPSNLGVDERPIWFDSVEALYASQDAYRGGFSPFAQGVVHTQQMAAEMPPSRMPIMAPIGPSPPLGRVELLSSNLGPAAAATSTQGPSDSFARWLTDLERAQEERLLQDAQRRFCLFGPQACLLDFRKWLAEASYAADEATLQQMRRDQLKTWLMCVRRLARRWTDSDVAVILPDEVRQRIDDLNGGKHVWGPINALRARAVAESAQRQLKRCEGLLRQSALAALVTRYVHPAVVQAAEAGCMACYTEIPTDDAALQALFQVVASEPLQTKEVGALLCAHLAIDGFEVEPKYHDPEYGLWRGFWVEKCNRLRLVLRW